MVQVEANPYLPLHHLSGLQGGVLHKQVELEIAGMNPRQMLLAVEASLVD